MTAPASAAPKTSAAPPSLTSARRVKRKARGSGYAEYDDAEREGIDPARLLEAYEVQAAASGTRTGVRVERSVSVEDCRTRERRAECDPGDCKPRA